MLGRLLVTLGGLVAIILTAALIGPLFVDWTGFRTDFETQASRILGKKVTVHGSVSARLLPFPSVSLSDVRVGQDVDGTPLVQVERFSMDAELAPFLSGEARIFDMRIEKPKARLRLLSDGRLDWMRGATPTAPAASVVLENVKITGGAIEFIDDQSGRTRRIEGLDAAMSTHSLAGPWRVDGSATVDGEKGRFSLTTTESDGKSQGLGLHVRLMPAAHPVEIDLDGALTVEGAKPVYKGKFAALLTNGEANAPAPRAKGTFELTNERVRVEDYRLEIGATDAPYIVNGEATLDVGAKPEFLLTAEGQQIDINDLGTNGVTAKTTRAPQTSVERRLHAMLAIAASIPVPQVQGKATFRLPAIVSGDTTLRDIQLEVRPAGNGWTVERAVAVLPGRTTVEANGRLKLDAEPSFAGNLLVASAQPPALAAWLTGGDIAAMPALSKAGFSANVSLSNTLQRFERLELIVGSSRLVGRLEHEVRKDETPALSADLKGELLDLDEAKAFAMLFGSDSLLGDHKVALKVNVDRLTATDAEAKNVDAVATYSDGVLSIDRLKIANLAGAAISLAGKPQTGPMEMSLQLAQAQDFLTLLARKLPGNPVLAAMARSATHFDDTSLTLKSPVSKDGKVTSVKLNGWSNGSHVGAELQFDTVDLARLLAGELPNLKLDATLENADTATLFGQAGLSPLPLAVEDGGLLALTVKTAKGKPSETALSFTAEKTRFKVDGNFAFDAAHFAVGNGQFTLSSDDLEPYLAMNGIAVPQTGGGMPVNLTGQLTIADDRYTLGALAGEMDGNKLSGDLVFERGLPDVKASGALSLDQASLAWLAEGMFGTVVDPVSGDLPQSAPGKPLPGRADLNIDLAIRNFDAGVFAPLQDVKTRLSYHSGAMELDGFTGGWLGGKLAKGRMALSNGDNGLMLRTGFDVENGDLASVLWQKDEKPVATGRFNLSLSAESSAKDLASLRSSLSGSGVLNLSNLVLNGVTLDVMGPLATAADLMEGQPGEREIAPLIETLVANGSTQVGKVTLPFQIVDGVFKVQGTPVPVAKGTITGSGRYALADHRLNAQLDLSFAPGEFAQEGGDPGAKLAFDGPVEAPKLQVDPTDSVNFLSVRLYERERRRVEQGQANIMEKQRLRREAALFKFRAAERDAQAREKAEAEARAKAEADAAAAAAAAAAKAAEDKARQQSEPDAKPKAAVDPDAAAKARAQAFAEAEAKARADAAAAADKALKKDADGVPQGSQKVIRKPLPPAGSVP
ncbi:MAG: AsmA family protein [Proteobacteria bacterium]|nr:AsmA family protein [Pseudomonadota bacterium]